ncbi:hypothetical protein HDU91_002457 [Kappamyces sp. JEL0680]|nr:hypothetical protein HDU91_002457 [Kappamyces sp. JEL0680]
MNQAKDLWKVGPTITNQGYSFSSSPPDTQHLYLAHLSTLISFIQTQFDLYLDRADRIQPTAETGRLAHRIIYETALATCKRGAVAEMGGSTLSEPAQGFYKTSILLLQALLQPSWDETSSERLGEEDVRDVQTLMDQVVIRLAKSS